MNEQDQTCTADGCASAPEHAHPTASVESTTIDIVSDVICPWCFIGKRRLEKALKLLGKPTGICVSWKPFQLNPHMPPNGFERREYRIAKFGSWERSQALDAQVAAAGAKEGITFAFDKMNRTPNTLDAHRLIWLAGKQSKQDAVVERLFHAYFEEGMDLNDQPTLVRLAVEGGLPAADANRLLATNEGRAEVLREEAHYKSFGVNGVPSFFIGGQAVFSGAAEPSVLAERIKEAL